MNGENYKHNVTWKGKIKGLPYKNDDGKDVCPRKTGPDCAHLSFIILRVIGSFYSFRNTPNHVFIA